MIVFRGREGSVGGEWVFVPYSCREGHGGFGGGRGLLGNGDEGFERAKVCFRGAWFLL